MFWGNQPMHAGTAIFGGKVRARQIGDWRISWESADRYRLWCLQEHPRNSRAAVVVMLNPGSLSGAGENLTRDTTLRVLRRLFEETTYNPFVVNLFNLATTKPDVLFESGNWTCKDYEAFSYKALPLNQFSAVMYAYGDYQNKAHYASEIASRIEEVRAVFAGIPEIMVPKNRSGTPKHPLPIQQQGLVDVFREKILGHASANSVRTAAGRAGRRP